MANKADAERKLKVGTGDRSERIRTLNFPEGRCTDHRIGLTVFGIEEVLNGEKLGILMEALKVRHEQDRIEALCADMAQEP